MLLQISLSIPNCLTYIIVNKGLHVYYDITNFITEVQGIVFNLANQSNLCIPVISITQAFDHLIHMLIFTDPERFYCMAYEHYRGRSSYKPLNDTSNSIVTGASCVLNATRFTNESHLYQSTVENGPSKVLHEVKMRSPMPTN